MGRVLAAGLVAGLLVVTPAAGSTVRYEPTAASLARHAAPAWWRDAKFGVFIHWGPYSVPAWGPVSTVDRTTNLTDYAEWYAEMMSVPGTATWQHHLATYGPLLNYDDFIGRWTASRWDPDAWIRLLEQAGAKYFVLTSKHSDGVALWCTKAGHRDTCDMGPRRDLVADLMAAAHRAHDVVRPGLYYSVPEWFSPAHKEANLYKDDTRWGSTERMEFEFAYENPLPRRNPYTQAPIPYTGYVPVSDYASGIVKPQIEELIHEFHPDILWCDIGGRETYFHADDFIADYYNAVPGGVVDDRCGDQTTHADYATVELPTDAAKPPFEIVQGLGGRGSSFGYNAAMPDAGYQPVPTLIDTLVDTVARGGNLMLDIGPRADGSIPQVMVDRLRGIGAWLKVDGEAIYGSHQWSQPAAGDVRFTVGASGFLYAAALGRPGPQLRIGAPVPVGPETRISLVGDDARPLPFHRDGAALVVDLPPSASSADRPVLRIGAPRRARLRATLRGRVVAGRLVLPRGLTRPVGCRGRVRAGGAGAPVGADCRFRVVLRAAPTRPVRVRFAGNPVLRPARERLGLGG
jgi:alpha-L-fucosidase